MSAHKRPVFLILFLLAFGANTGFGQTRDRGPIILELPASTRALALGNSFALGSGDSDAIFYHPGLLNRAQGLSGSFQRFTENGSLTALSSGQSWLGGGVALGLQHLSYEVPAEAIRTAEDIKNLPADEASLRDPGQAAASEMVLSVGYGRTFMGAQVGAVGKMVEQRLGSRKAGTLAVDLGLASSAGPVTLGLAVQNLGPNLSMADGEIPLPTRFTLGASSRSAPVGPLDLSLSSALAYRLDGDFVPSVGLEVGYWPVNGRTFVGRIGYRYLSEEFSALPVTFGGAFLGDDISLEYAFQGYDTGDPSHRFSVGWR